MGVGRCTGPGPVWRRRARRLATVPAVVALAAVGLVLDATGAGEMVPVEVLGVVETPPDAASRPTTTQPDRRSAATVEAPVGFATTNPPSTTPPLSPSERGELALELIEYDWRTRLPNWEIVFESAREEMRGLTLPPRYRIEVYVRPDDSVEFIARVIAHELGHAIDLELNDDDDRSRWRAVRGVSDDVPWWPEGTSYDFDTLAGDFAEAFAVLETGVDPRSRVAGALTPDQLAVLRELIA